VQEINLYNLLGFYLKKWWIIVSLTLVGLASGFIYSQFIQVPLYKSGATLILIRTSDKTSVQDVTQINNYKELFISRRVLEPVIKKLRLNQSYDELVSSIETVNDKDTEVIKVTVSSNNPKTSKSIIDGAVSSFKEQVKKLYVIDNVQVIDNAYLSDVPYNVHKETTLALSATAGFITSIIVLFFVYDYKMNSKDKDLTKTTKKSEPKNLKKNDIQKKKFKSIDKKAKVTKTSSDKPIRGIFFSKIISSAGKTSAQTPRNIKRAFNKKETPLDINQEELVFVVPKISTAVFEPKHGKGIVIKSKERPRNTAWLQRNARIRDQQKSLRTRTLFVSSNKNTQKDSSDV